MAFIGHKALQNQIKQTFEILRVKVAKNVANFAFARRLRVSARALCEREAELL